MQGTVPVRLLLILVLLAFPAAGSGHASANAPDNPTLPDGAAGRGAGRTARPTFEPPRPGRFVEVRDALEQEKLDAGETDGIRFRNGRRLHPAPGLGPGTRLPLAGPHLVQFPGRIRKEWREAIERLGVVVHDYLQSNTLIVTIPEGASDGLRSHLAQGLIRHLSPLPEEARVDVTLSVSWEGERLVTVVFFGEPGDVEWEAIRRLLRVEQQRPEDSPPVARGWVTADGARALSALASVRWIEPYEPGRLHNLEATMSGAADVVAVAGPYTGAGVRVAVDDSGIARTDLEMDCFWENASYHPDLAAWRIADEWDFHNSDGNTCDDNTHGTHVAGTIGGNGTVEPAYTGVAPGATFLIYKDCSSNGFGFAHFSSVLARAAAHDADIVANSWGGSNGAYNQDSYDADRAVRGAFPGSNGQPRRMVVTVSAGNNFDLATAPSTAKNAIAVGATKDGNTPSSASMCIAVHTCAPRNCGCGTNPTCEDVNQPASERICFSNIGPVDTDGDGHTRIKPDLVAPGVNIVSTYPPVLTEFLPLPTPYSEKSGTSMAQPIVAGTAALMLEAYPGLRGEPEMIKARLLATAVSLGDTSQYGHGMLDAYHAIFDSATMGTAAWVGGPVPATGVDDDRFFSVPAGFSEVRVYVTWSDPPSLATELVDDIDLRVYDDTGALVGASVSYDDNVEWIRIATGVPGRWRASIRGYNVPDSSARFGLAAVVAYGNGSVAIAGASDAACVRPGTFAQITSTLTTAGPVAAASSTSLDLPDNLSLFAPSGVWLETAVPGRSHFYGFDQIEHDPLVNIYTLYQGAVLPESPRTALWPVRALPGTPDGPYTIQLWAGAAGMPYSASTTVPLTVDGVPPSDITGLASADHAAGTCSNDLSVGTYWNASNDGSGCGLAGYSVSWSTTYPIMPDTVPEIDPAVTMQEWNMTEDTQDLYFNIRSVDLAGNGSAHQSWGPIRLDATPPAGATGLASATHPPGSCSPPGSVGIDWVAATDGNCGLAGYSLLWSGGAPALPDDVAEIGPVTSHAESLPGSNTPYWFNIRPVDAAGNWAPGAASFGPITLDTVPGEVGGLLLQPAGTDLAFAWTAEGDADFYRVVRDTSPLFTTPLQVGPDSAVTSLLQSGGMTGSEPIVFYRVVGTNICGLQGP